MGASSLKLLSKFQIPASLTSITVLATIRNSSNRLNWDPIPCHPMIPCSSFMTTSQATKTNPFFLCDIPTLLHSQILLAFTEHQPVFFMCPQPANVASNRQLNFLTSRLCNVPLPPSYLRPSACNAARRIGSANRSKTVHQRSSREHLFDLVLKLSSLVIKIRLQNNSVIPRPLMATRAVPVRLSLNLTILIFVGFPPWSTRLKNN